MWSTFVISCALLILAFGPDGVDASPVREKFIVYPSEWSPREGQTLTLSCVIGGPAQASIPSPSSYEWIKDGNVIQEQRGRTLTLPRLTVQDNGDYKCGPPTSDIPREVYHLQIIHDDTSLLRNSSFYIDSIGSLLVGQTLTLRCYLLGSSGIAPPYYVWVKDGNVIPGETGQTFTLHSLTSQHEGDYHCGDPKFSIHRQTYHVKVLTVLPTPEIIKDKVPVCGRSSSLNCIIIGDYTLNGNITYTWYKDSEEIKGESGPELKFINVKEADEGKYTCTVREGPIETTSEKSPIFDLTPLVAPEVFMKTSYPNYMGRGILGENLTLICEVSRAVPRVPPDGYTWSFSPADNQSPQHLREKTKTISLAPLTIQHSGQYHCQARNDQTFEKVTLIGKASIDVDVVYLKNIHLTYDQEVYEGDIVNLTCGVESHPEAHLVWIVNRQEVRHIVGKLDHYVIKNVACSDDTSYTCCAFNKDMPGREEVSTTHVHVHCKKVPTTERPPFESTQADVSAPFNFTLPEHSAIVVVNPQGKDVITIYQNCSYVISAEFLPRCLQPTCDLARRHFLFILSSVTQADEGVYLCREAGKHRRLIPNCMRELTLKRQESDETPPPTMIVWRIVLIIPVLLAAIAVLLLLKYRTSIRKYAVRLRGFPWIVRYFPPQTAQPTETEVKKRCQSFQNLYVNGRVYVFPNLVPPSEQPMSDSEKENDESASFLSQSQSTFRFVDLLRYTLKQSTGKNDLPSFLLHNTRLIQEKIILILSRKLGPVIMVVKPKSNQNFENFLKEATKNVLQAKEAVEMKLKGLVTSGTIKTAIAMPDASNTEENRKKFLSPNAEVLLGEDEETLHAWVKRLESRPPSQVWDTRIPAVDSPDTAFKMTISKLLTLAGTSSSRESHNCLSANESWLLTPEQMDIRDSEASLLHIYGPPGSGKTKLLIHRARQWLAEGKAVVVAVGREVYDVLLAHIVNAVQEDQNEEARKRIRVCRVHKALKMVLKELGGQNVEICLIIDTLRESTLFENMIEAVGSRQVAAVWSVCRDNLQTINDNLSKITKHHGWESARLPDCIRCTEDTVSLLNRLGKGSSDYQPLESCNIPRSQNIPRWKVVDHCRHPGRKNPPSDCGSCMSQLACAKESSKQDCHWSDWIALHTGDPNRHADIESLCKVLQVLGVPASFDSYYEIVASHGGNLNSSETDVAKWLERVSDGMNEGGKPVLHLVRISDIGGVEKDGVLLVHLDERDIDPNYQSPEQRNTRLADHRRQWIRAVACCKGQVIILLLTPSPARSLLNLPEQVIP